MIHTLQGLFTAIETGQLPADMRLTLDNDDVHAYVEENGTYVCRFRSDPSSLLRELLDHVGLEYDEA